MLGERLCGVCVALVTCGLFDCILWTIQSCALAFERRSPRTEMFAMRCHHSCITVETFVSHFHATRITLSHWPHPFDKLHATFKMQRHRCHHAPSTFPRRSCQASTILTSRFLDASTVTLLHRPYRCAKPLTLHLHNARTSHLNHITPA